MRTIFQLCLMAAASSAAGAEPDSLVEPTAVVTAFFQAVAAKNVDRIVELTVPVDEAAKPAVRAYSERAAGRPTPAIVSHLQLSKTAVVIFHENPNNNLTVDLDPAYLVRRDGKWFVLYKLTRFDRPESRISDEERVEFERLAAWYERQKPDLQSLLRNRP
jgi:hypothetical protein